jgi:peptidoglycan hydrolase CwlO-like protein
MKYYLIILSLITLKVNCSTAQTHEHTADSLAREVAKIINQLQDTSGCDIYIQELQSLYKETNEEVYHLAAETSSLIKKIYSPRGRSVELKKEYYQPYEEQLINTKMSIKPV